MNKIKFNCELHKDDYIMVYEDTPVKECDIKGVHIEVYNDYNRAYDHVILSPENANALGYNLLKDRLLELLEKEYKEWEEVDAPYTMKQGAIHALTIVKDKIEEGDI